MLNDTGIGVGWCGRQSAARLAGRPPVAVGDLGAALRMPRLTGRTHLPFLAAEPNGNIAVFEAPAPRTDFRITPANGAS